MPNLPSTDNALPWLSWPWHWPALAPQSLTQPINPGWSFGPVINVSSANSSAPDTEREIVSRHSYGRQLGRLMDAVELLLDERGSKAKPDSRAEGVRELRREIEAIKLAAARRRVEALRADLALLKRADAGEHARIVAELRRALDA